jgi:NADH:ubiquinone oxidoreductase subunit 6 (subunit J)
MNRLFRILAVAVAVWVLGSFVGVMLDGARADLWTRSLMWAMLASVILAPVFLFVGTSSTDSSPPSSPEAEQSFDVEGGVDVSKKRTTEEPGARESEGWPYDT